MGAFGQPAQAQQAAAGTGTPPFNPVMVQGKSSWLEPGGGVVIRRYKAGCEETMQSITMMPQYKDKSFEELRVEDLRR